MGVWILLMSESRPCRDEVINNNVPTRPKAEEVRCARALPWREGPARAHLPLH